MKPETSLDVTRIQALTDAAFAVAMTILILEVKIPAGLSLPEMKAYFFKNTFAELAIYFVGFVTLGIFWIGSHFHHNLVTKTDRTSSWLNILFLMTICVIPFSVGFLKNYRAEKLSIIFYSGNLIVASILNYLMLCYVWKKKYIRPYYRDEHFKSSRLRILIPIFFYLTIIGISFISTTASIFLFLAPIFLHAIPERGNEVII